MIEITAKEFLNNLGIENRGVLGCNFSGQLSELLDKYYAEKLGSHFLATAEIQKEIEKELKKRGILKDD